MQESCQVGQLANFMPRLGAPAIFVPQLFLFAYLLCGAASDILNVQGEYMKQRYYYSYNLLDGSTGLYFVDAAGPAQALSIASYHINSIAGLKSWRHYDVSH